MTKNNKLFYAGIGSRETPEGVQIQMTELASLFEDQGWVLRSGNAGGADQAFAAGVKHDAQIWLPWKSFNDDWQLKYPSHEYRVIQDDDLEAESSVNAFHKNGKGLRPAVRKLMARNCRQIVGQNENDSSFVVCWTRDGGPTGGTGQAVRIARYFNIPVFNLFSLTPEEIIDILAT